MFELKLHDSPQLPRHLERKSGNYVIGIHNAHIRDPSDTHAPYGQVYIKHLTGRENTVKRLRLTLKHLFRKAEKNYQRGDYKFFLSDIPLSYGNFTIDIIKTSIVTKYGKIIEKDLLSKWFEPLLKQYEDYYRRVKEK